MASSRISQIYTRHRAMLRRLDDLESRIASRVSAHRRRAANILEETSTFRKTHMRIFISHRVEGGGDDEDDNDDEEDDKNTKGETTVEAGNNNDDDDAKTGVAAAAAVAPPRPGGGKDFSALLHSSAHKAVDSESTTTSSQHPSPSRKKGVRKWTLVIEGGLLIPQTDHESAKNTNVRLENGLPILGWREEVVNGNSNPSAVAAAGGGGSGGENDNTKITPPANTTKADIPMRDQWRGGTTERENEKDVEPPLKFTHLFDKLEVTFNVIKQLSDSSNNNNNIIKGLEPTDNVAITRSGFGSTTTPLDPSSSTALDSSAENNVPTVTWERHAKKISSSSTSSTTTPDAHAFFVVHNEEGEYKPMGGKVFKRVFPNTSVAAKIKLYRRQPEGGEENYVPSTQLCNIFFPTFIGKRGAAELKSSKDKSGSGSGGGGGGSSKSKKRKRPGEGGLSRTVSSANLENEASINTTALNQDEEATTVTGAAATSSVTIGQGGGGASSSIDETKDAHIPNTVTMDEALYAIFYYIKTRNLQDVTDLSIVNNNDVLTDLFGCSRMLFSSVRGLLLERQLLVKVESDTHPLIFNYEMTLEGAEPLLAKQRRSAKASNKSEDVELTTRRRVANPDYEDPPTPPVADQLDVVHHQTMLSCDVDIDIPSLFPVQTRDILRRTKYREFEYSSNRNKAIRSLVSTKVDEETAKLVVADAVSGKGFASYHKQALMAMAKGSHEGGEAQRAAWIDLRTAALMEKLEEQSSLARGCWDVVDACQGLADQSS